MPLYEYRCPACDQVWEALQDRWDSPAPDCPGCGQARGNRQMSAFAVGSAPTRGATPAPGPCGTNDCACRRN